jgi:hypothetical protein
MYFVVGRLSLIVWLVPLKGRWPFSRSNRLKSSYGVLDIWALSCLCQVSDDCIWYAWGAYSSFIHEYMTWRQNGHQTSFKHEFTTLIVMGFSLSCALLSPPTSSSFGFVSKEGHSSQCIVWKWCFQKGGNICYWLSRWLWRGDTIMSGVLQKLCKEKVVWYLMIWTDSLHGRSWLWQEVIYAKLEWILYPEDLYLLTIPQFSCITGCFPRL